MACWRIEFEEKAKKQISKLNKDHRKKIESYFEERILTLAHPKLCGKPLLGNKRGLWRYRVDKFRIVCKLEDELLIIVVISIAKRDVVYED